MNGAVHSVRYYSSALNAEEASIENAVCPVCDKGRLSPTRYWQFFFVGGVRIRVDDLEACLCSYCEADPVLPKQVRRNHEKVAEAVRQARDGLTDWLTGVGG